MLCTRVSGSHNIAMRLAALALAKNKNYNDAIAKLSDDDSCENAIKSFLHSHKELL